MKFTKYHRSRALEQRRRNAMKAFIQRCREDQEFLDRMDTDGGEMISLVQRRTSYYDCRIRGSVINAVFKMVIQPGVKQDEQQT